ncbi:hypothetical protein [Desulfoferula mesophila]|uniref:Uncharacterized protein n=1 Tax=Desulfoferula mesophila TaxID=3058419 RepID=A0AAU9EMI5_9BACT|nr:hypothetical protein FAK_14750 [Desulfoferula mesophilus]
MLPEEMKQIIETTDDANCLMDLAEAALSSGVDEYVDWGEKLFKIALDKTEDTNSLIGIGIKLARNRWVDLDDHAYDAFSKAADRANNASELKLTANYIALFQVLYDKKWAREVYQMAIEKAECMEDYLEIADSIAAADFIYDIPWAGELLRLAIESAVAIDKVPVIIHWIFEEDGSCREEWALPVFEEAVGMTIDEAFKKYRIMIARY